MGGKAASMTEEYIGWLDDDWNTVLDQNQPIVRCRDCRYYGYYDGSTWCSRTYEQVPSGTCDYQTVEPDGFCAWGERKCL